MDFSAALKHIETWPVEERIHFVETVWDQLVNRGFDPQPTASQRAELDKRLDSLEMARDEVIPWESARDRIRRS